MLISIVRQMKQIIDFIKEMTRGEKIVLIVIGIIIYSVLLFNWGFNVGQNKAAKSIKTDTITVTSITHDTVKIDNPIPVDNFKIKTVVDTFINYKVDTFQHLVQVEIPIEQKIYKQDSLYIAYVSGYKAQLDSINVYRRTITNTVTINNKIVKKKHIGLGVNGGLGYGILSKKIEPFIGFGINYVF